jgi:hypothetical protein
MLHGRGHDVTAAHGARRRLLSSSPTCGPGSFTPRRRPGPATQAVLQNVQYSEEARTVASLVWRPPHTHIPGLPSPVPAGMIAPA